MPANPRGPGRPRNKMAETPDPGVVPHDPEGPTRVSRILPRTPEPRAALFQALKWVFVVALIGVFVYAAAEELRTFHWHDVREAFGKIDRLRVAKALGFLAANYLILTLYDWASFRVLGLKRAWHLVAPRAAAAFAFSNFVGLGFVSGAAVRLRLYKDLVDSPATL